MRSRLGIILGFVATICVPEGRCQNPDLASQYLEVADLIYSQQKEAIEIAKENYVMAAAADTNNVRANYMAGNLFVETVNKDSSTFYFLRVKRLDPRYRFDIDYWIGRGYQYGLDFDQALRYFEAYEKRVLSQPGYRGRDKVPLGDVRRRIFECENGRDIVSNPSRYEIINVGPQINSEWPDYAPVISHDEELMIFTSRRQDGNVNQNVDKDNFFYEDIFYSEWRDGKWSPARNIGETINTQFHDSNIALSFDGTELYLYKDVNYGDIYVSNRNENGSWGKPVPITDRVNSRSFTEDAVSITPNREVMFFTSNRPGGYGGSDIYFCIKDDRGDWSKTYNLGPRVNSKYDEEGPFIDYDGLTLYFSSKGHKGYGGYDIFKTVYDTIQERWQEPVNLGYPVNTPDDEVYFVSTRKGKRGYYSSMREGGLGFTDIYQVNLRGEEKLDSDEMLEASISPEITVIPEYKPEILIPDYNIYFDQDGFRIRQDYLDSLNLLCDYLKDYDELRARISGYASPEGNPRYNLDLSHKRALKVFYYMVEKGIAEERITAQGFGSVKDKSTTSAEARKVVINLLDPSRN